MANGSAAPIEKALSKFNDCEKAYSGIRSDGAIDKGRLPFCSKNGIFDGCERYWPSKVKSGVRLSGGVVGELVSTLEKSIDALEDSIVEHGE